MNPINKFEFQIDGLTQAQYTINKTNNEEFKIFFKFSNKDSFQDFIDKIFEYINSCKYSTMSINSNFPFCIIAPNKNANIPYEWRIKNLHQLCSFIWLEAHSKEAKTVCLEKKTKPIRKNFESA